VEDGWVAIFDVQVKGGDGTYTFYWEDSRIEAEPKESEERAFILTVPGRDGLIVGTIRVVSGNQEKAQEASARVPPDCP